MNAGLETRLRAAAAELNDAAVDEQYRDPFWLDRYGERGRRFAVEDGLHHFSYVAEAIAAASPALIVKYARWLRSVLVARGMCSEHLAEALRIRGRLVASQCSDSGPAVAVFAAAEAALQYSEGPAAALAQIDRAGPAMAVASRSGVPVEEVDRDLRALLSYLGDALAAEDPEIFLAEVEWRAGFDRRRGRPDAYTATVLAALVEAVEVAPARALLEAARSRLT